MKHTATIAATAIALISLAVSCKKQDTPKQDNPEPQAEISITWDKSSRVSWKGGYGRIHRLNDGRLMAVYEHGGDACYKFSSDKGRTWTAEKVGISKMTLSGGLVVNVANPEFAQLSSTNPHHPDRIIFAGNMRPQDHRSDLCPYSIVYAVSDDGGKTWSSRTTLYESTAWSDGAMKGCWEPFVLELPNGDVYIFFADESPYYVVKKDYQNISFQKSSDGGDTWPSKYAYLAIYAENLRDGMPVAMVYDNNIYVAIEHYDKGTHFYPQVVCNPASEWTTIVGAKDSRRFDPMLKPLDSKNNYYGAPYLIQTDNYIVLSYQSSEGSSAPNTDHSVMEVVACPKSEVKDGVFTTMRAATRPNDINQSSSRALWNSLCHLGGDEILAVSDCNGIIAVTPGVISGK